MTKDVAYFVAADTQRFDLNYTGMYFLKFTISFEPNLIKNCY